MKETLGQRSSLKIKMGNKFALFGLLFLSSCATLKINYPICDFPEHSPYPGGVINQTLKISSSEITSLKTDQENIYFCQFGLDQWRILLPISLSVEIKPIVILNKERTILKVPIFNKEYKQSKITIDNKDLVSPPAKYLPRIKKESELGKIALGIVSNIVHSSLKMSLPIEGIKSSEFGVKRFINNEPRNRHTGLDIAASVGTQVISPLSGKVILVGDFYYRGKTVFLDHGGGIISTYSHMSEISVKQGQTIKKNEDIGKVGQTGRVTGPHLHWQVVLSGIPVDPELFLDQPF